jgi:large subunit ribosomal protein L7/L12
MRIMANVTKQDVIDFIANMTVLELSEFVKELEEKFGVSAAAVAVAAAPQAGPAPAAEPVEEKTEFDVVLSSAGDKKIQEIGRAHV